MCRKRGVGAEEAWDGDAGIRECFGKDRPDPDGG